METKILGISGRKQSGKNTAANFLVGSFMRAMEFTKDFKINSRGELVVTDILGNDEYAGVFDVTKNSVAMRDFCNSYLNSVVKVYSFADLLKEVCMIFGLTHEQCYGTDAEKNTYTALNWENMPGIHTVEPPEGKVGAVTGRLGKYYEKCAEGLVYHAPGPMTAREVMQFVGTEIFRKMYHNVWAEATINRIKADAPMMAIIPDTRFPNEVDTILSNGGQVIRLLRDPNNGQDVHSSEVALDNYPVERYLSVIDNREMSIQEQNEAVAEVLKGIQWMPQLVSEEIYKQMEETL